MAADNDQGSTEPSRAEESKHRQTQKDTDRHGQTRKDTDSTEQHRQTQINTDRHRQTQTETDRDRQPETAPAAKERSRKRKRESAQNLTRRTVPQTVGGTILVGRFGGR